MQRRDRAGRAALLLAGLIVPQLILFGPSLLGQRILLPLDLLAQPDFYLPRTPAASSIIPHNRVLDDQLLEYEMARRFAVSEVRAGRVPLWTPYDYAGAPFATWGKYSPFSIPHYLFPSPVTLAWVHLLKSLVAGAGAYAFFRRVLAVRLWPALFGAWCYPLTAFFVFWEGYPLTLVAAWYPWVLVATDRALSRPTPRAAIALGLFSAFALLAGQLDLAAQVLLAAVVYASLWLAVARATGHDPRRLLAGAAAVVAGLSLAVMLSAPYWMPLVEYGRTGARLQARGEGEEERPPVGLRALPEVVLPHIYGSTQRGSVRIVPGNQLESAAAAYVGLPATLLLAPLAWLIPRRRSLIGISSLMALLGLAWDLGMPGLVDLLRAPFLNMLSHNRLVFVTGFALLTLAVAGLEALQGAARGRALAAPAFLVSVAVLYCAYRATHLPEAVAIRLEAAVRAGRLHPALPDLDGVREVQGTFSRSSSVAAGLGLTALGLLVLGRARLHALGTLMLVDLLVFAHDVNPQCAPDLYFPRIAALARVSACPPGRTVAVKCLPASLHQTHGLRDVRGYDGVDPADLVDLLETARSTYAHPLPYGRVRSYVPDLRLRADGHFDVPPVLSMLGVRYLIFRGAPTPGVSSLIREEDYWVAENRAALPRAFVPRHVRVASREEILQAMARRDFDPRLVAYLEGPFTLPGPALGAASVRDEVPTRVTLSVEMQTAGLVVLADRWDVGWQAELDGEAAPLLRVNHALRGVVVPAGRSTLVFRYAPRSLRWGLTLCGLGLAMAGVMARRSRGEAGSG